MKYQWLKTDSKTCEELSQELGVKVLSITRGSIVVGYEDGFDFEGNPAQVPITKQGVELEFDGELTTEQLSKLRMKFPLFKREGEKGFFEAVQNNLDLEGNQKAAFKLSQYYGLTQAQLETYIENNITNLARAKEFLKELSAVILWLVKQTKLDQ